MRISVIGSGVVGSIVGKGFKQLGHDVIFFDISSEKIKQLQKEGLNSTNDIDYAIGNSDVSFITVPTPTIDDKIELTYLRNATENIARQIKKKKKYHLVIVKSTVVPNTTEKVVKPILENVGLKCGDGFGLCMNPEFLTEIHRSWNKDPSASRDFFTEERIVIGEIDKKSGDILEEMYKPLKVPIFRTNLKTAELIKYASNCCLASRISYWNEIFYICNKLGIDSNFVANIAAADKRIGKYGTVHGLAFGGKCFPKDLQAFIRFAEENGYDPVFLKAVRDINQRIKKDRGVRE